MYRSIRMRMKTAAGTSCCFFGAGLLPFLLAAAITGTTDALKDVSVTIPQAVKVEDTVTLQCKYNLQGEPLYTVKWYKGQNEFFRYIPKELPSTQVFALAGIDVDISKSSPNEVVLRNVQPEVTGRYKCEVSSDAPNFYTFMVSGYMYVIDVPEEEPVMLYEKDLLEMGYTLKANCTTPPSFPPVNITWLLNGKKINESWLKHYPSSNAIVTDQRRQPLITQSGLELEIDSSTFERGKARLQCVANLFALYRKEVEVVMEEEKPRPRPSSELRTRDASVSLGDLLGKLWLPMNKGAPIHAEIATLVLSLFLLFIGMR